MNSLLTQGILIEFLVVLTQFMTSVFLFGNIMVWLHNDVEPMDNTETDRQTVFFSQTKYVQMKCIVMVCIILKLERLVITVAILLKL